MPPRSEAACAIIAGVVLFWIAVAVVLVHFLSKFW